MNNWTKAFKYSFFFTFVILIICSFIFQNKVYINIMEGNIFYNEPLITAWKSKFNNLSQNVIPNIRRQKTVNSKRVTKIMGMNPFVQYAFEILDSFKPKDISSNNPDTYNIFKSMVMSWNLDASKWALNASNYYRSIVQSRPNHLNDAFDFQDSLDYSINNVYIEDCNCFRETPTYPEIFGNQNIFSEDSTCSLHAYARGSHQRVIGFSFYGKSDSKIAKERKYFEGISENLNLMPKYYKDWIIRLYYDLEADNPLMDQLCNLTCSNPSIDLCHVKNIPSEGDVSDVFPMNWRFLPILDPQVDIYVSRDLDSRINEREFYAVSEWLHGKKAFHFMRDHPAHSIEILGSGWGLRLGKLERNMVLSSFKIATKDSLFWASRNSYGPDQGFLKRYLWPWGKWNSISHDSYSCAHFGRTSPFPTQRKIEPNNFVASVVSANDTLLYECPMKCRKESSWKYC